MTSRPKYNQYLTSNRRQVPAGVAYSEDTDLSFAHVVNKMNESNVFKRLNTYYMNVLF